MMIYTLNVIAIITNSYLIGALCKLGKIKLISFRLVIYLSLSDVFSGIFGISSNSLVQSTSHTKKSYQAIFFIGLLNTYFMNLSVILVLVIAIDRFIHMKFLLDYQRIMTRKKAAIAVFSSVVFTAHTIVVLYILPTYQREFVIKNINGYKTYRVILSFIYIFLMLATFLLYFWTYFAIAGKMKSKKDTEVSRTERGIDLTEQCSDHGSRRRQSRSRSSKQTKNPVNDFVRGMLFVVCCLIICVLPNICFSVVVTLISMHGSDETKTKIARAAPMVLNVTYLTFVLNSSLNAIFLILSCSDIRALSRKIFMRCFNTTFQVSIFRFS